MKTEQKIIEKQDQIILNYKMILKTKDSGIINTCKVKIAELESELSALQSAKEGEDHWDTPTMFCPNCKQFEMNRCILTNKIVFGTDSCSLFEHKDPRAEDVSDTRKDDDENMRNIYVMLHDFRNWNRDWDLYSSKHPKSVDDFAGQLSKRFNVRLKSN